MRFPNLRYGRLEDFVGFTQGMTIEEIAQALRCTGRSVRNWLAQRQHIPWWTIEVLQNRWEKRRAAGGSTPVAPYHAPKREKPSAPERTNATPARQSAPASAPARPAMQLNVPTPTAAADVSRSEIEAWIGVHSPHYLSSARSFETYARGWRVPEKIQRAKQDGTFDAVLRTWDYMRSQTPTSRTRTPIMGDSPS